MKIRPATPLDIPQMIAMERESDTAAHWGEGQYGALFDANAVPRKVLVAEIAGQDLISNSACNRICAFIVLRAFGDEWEIENVLVESELRRSGIGTLLLNEMLQICRAAKCARLFLEVRESNLPARKLYEKHGFRESGRRSSYYENPTEDALVLGYEFPATALEKA